MAKTLQNIFNPGDKIAQAYIIESWHVSQSVDAFTGAEAYDIIISGSLNRSEERRVLFRSPKHLQLWR